MKRNDREKMNRIATGLEVEGAAANGGRRAGFRFQQPALVNITATEQGAALLAQTPTPCQIYRWGKMTALVVAPTPDSGWFMTVAHDQRQPMTSEIEWLADKLIPADVPLAVSLARPGEPRNSLVAIIGELPTPELLIGLSRQRVGAVNELIQRRDAARGRAIQHESDAPNSSFAAASYGYANALDDVVGFLMATFGLTFIQTPEGEEGPADAPLAE